MDLDRAEFLAFQLVARHAPGWQVEWYPGNRSLPRGLCNHVTKTIKLSKFKTKRDPRNEVKDTILHEIAHALLPVEAPDHGKEWKRLARSLGVRVKGY